MTKEIVRRNYKQIFILFFAGAVLLLTACLPVHANNPHISLLEVQYRAVYPQGKTEITCTATSPGGEALNYTWICTEGTFTGSGEKVTWKAPNKYGEFPVMVIVADASGNEDTATITVKVVVNENPQTGCESCGR